MSSDDLVAAAQAVVDSVIGAAFSGGRPVAEKVEFPPERFTLYVSADAMERLRAALAAKPEPGLATEDPCPCGHLDDEHVHYCSSDDVPIGICPCDAEYVRLSAGTTEP